MAQKTVGDKTRTRGKLSQSLSTPSSPHKHSPQKNIPAERNLGEEDTGLTQILARLDQLDKKMSEANQTAMRTNTDIAKLTKLLADSRREHDADRRRLQITTRGLEQLQEANRRLTTQLNDIENHTRICNIKIDGKVEETTEDLGNYLKSMMTHLSPSVSMADVLTIHRIGRKPLSQQQQPTRKPDRPRSILIVFKCIQARNSFFYNRAKLGKIAAYKGIYLNDDTTQLTRKLREDYRSVAALARTAGCEIRVHGDGIIIDGHKYKHNDTLPERFSLAKAKTVDIGGELFFHSEHSYLSNFFPSPITDEEVTYPTAEHRLQAAMCRLAGDSDRLHSVIQAHTPLEARMIADQIPDTAEWRHQREEALKTTLDEKFSQNPHLADLLLATGKTKLNEASNNSYYGIGATLHSREVRDQSFRGLNRLGQALMSKRDALRVDQN